jgi:hypothetical protein
MKNFAAPIDLTGLTIPERAYILTEYARTNAVVCDYDTEAVIANLRGAPNGTDSYEHLRNTFAEYFPGVNVID